ncbi:ABC transporter ATP-binding protein [Mycoplasma sp. 3398]
MDHKYKILSIITILLTLLQVICFLFVPIFIGNLSNLIAQNSFLQLHKDQTSILDYSKINILRLFTIEGTLSYSIKWFTSYFALVLLIGTIVTLLGSMLASYISTGAAKHIRKSLWQHLTILSEKDIEFFSHSKILTRFTIDISRIQIGISSGLRLSIIGPCNLIFGLVFALLTDLNLSITLGAFVPALFVIMAIAGMSSMRLFPKEQKAYDEINNEARESILGVRVIKSYNLENVQLDKFQNSNKNWSNVAKKSWIIYHITFSFINLFANIVTSCILLATGFIIRSRINQGSYGVITDLKVFKDFSDVLSLYKTKISNATTFINYVMFITIGVVMSSFAVFLISRGNVSSKRVIEILKKEADIDFIKSNKVITKGEIELKNVSFKYHEESENFVIKDINLKINPGEKIGIIGPTGSGKTTLARLLSHEFKTIHGTISIDGNDINEIDTTSLRKNISFVYQKPILLSGTIKSNLLMANNKATQEDLEYFAKLAFAYDFINAYNDGFEHEVLKNGSNLSGGQKQRISIAQGLLKQPKILILDDATSALDTKTEKMVKDNIDMHFSSRKIVTIIITQKISSIIDADRILVMENGLISDIGTHKELLKTSKLYLEIAKTQLGGLDV